jgi:uncharacterized protein YegP (UPF0339 family)
MAGRKHVQLTKGRDGRWRFKQVSANGKVTRASQGYAHRRSAIKAAKRDIPHVEIKG